jgi:hypothetical protein
MNNSAAAFDTNYITLQEACSVTGLSEQTLNRFAQAEYFKSKSDNDQLLIDRAELFSVLNIKDTKKNRLSIAKPSIQEQAPTTPVAETSNTSSVITEPAQTVNQEPLSQTENTPEVTVTSDSALSFEIEKLKAVAELHEKFIELKEKEIASLINERDWLRARVEKLEEKSDRDQLILVSMSETQRTFANQINNRKSSFQLALEWLGVSPQPTNKSES